MPLKSDLFISRIIKKRGERLRLGGGAFIGSGWMLARAAAAQQTRKGIYSQDFCVCDANEGLCWSRSREDVPSRTESSWLLVPML